MKLSVTPLGTIAPYPKGNKNCPGYLIRYGDYKVLFDCGNGATRLLKMPEDLNNLIIYITHLHPDHIGDLTALLQAIMVYRRYGYINSEITIYMPQALEKEYDYLQDEMCWMEMEIGEKFPIDYEYIKKFAELAGVEIKTISNLNVHHDDFCIKSQMVPHSTESYAFRFNSDDGDITYSGDTGPKNRLREFAKDSDIFICESTYLTEQNRFKDDHLYAFEAGLIARAANVKKLVLTHFWPDIDKNHYVIEAKKTFENVVAAEEGKKLVLRR